MLGLSPWVSFLIVLLTAMAARLAPVREAVALRRLLEERRRLAPLIVGLLTGAITLWVWGSLRRSAVMHDESAYLLQAELFARFRWTGGGPALPQFFEQLYVLVDPVLASKYPPGNSLLLVPGVWIGLPGLPVIVMNACSGALFFVLVRRISHSLTALLAWLTWITSFPMLYYHANYMSEGVTSLAWLVAWWAILRWRDGDGARWLSVAAAAVAWSAITRPLTALALGTCIAAVVLRLAWRGHRWRDLAPASALALVIVAIIPIWNWRTTGDIQVTPLTAYTRAYVPFDTPGFGVGPQERPSPRLPRDQWVTSTAFYEEHARHTPAALPSIARARLDMLDRDAWYEWRGGLRVFALLGLLVLPLEGWVALAAFALQFVLYLSYAHPAWWTMYYVEGAPVLAFLTALGIVRALASLTGFTMVSGTSADGQTPALPTRVRRVREVITRFIVRLPPGPPSPRLCVAVGLVAVTATLPGILVARQVRAKIVDDHAYYDAFAELVRRIPERRAVVFVRYGPKHYDGLTLIRNVADPSQAPVLTAYDRGAENEALLRSAADRSGYLFDETSWTLRRLQRRADSTRTPDVAGKSAPVASVSRR